MDDSSGPHSGGFLSSLGQRREAASCLNYSGLVRKLAPMASMDGTRLNDHRQSAAASPADR